jgi:hypothetical protein
MAGAVSDARMPPRVSLREARETQAQVLRYDRLYCDPFTGFPVVFDRDQLDRDDVGFRNHEGRV